jgi:hypothetical protein
MNWPPAVTSWKAILLSYLAVALLSATPERYPCHSSTVMVTFPRSSRSTSAGEIFELPPIILDGSMRCSLG